MIAIGGDRIGRDGCVKGDPKSDLQPRRSPPQLASSARLLSSPLDRSPRRDLSSAMALQATLDSLGILSPLEAFLDPLSMVSLCSVSKAIHEALNPAWQRSLAVSKALFCVAEREEVSWSDMFHLSQVTACSRARRMAIATSLSKQPCSRHYIATLPPPSLVSAPDARSIRHWHLAYVKKFRQWLEEGDMTRYFEGVPDYAHSEDGDRHWITDILMENRGNWWEEPWFPIEWDVLWDRAKVISRQWGPAPDFKSIDVPQYFDVNGWKKDFDFWDQVERQAVWSQEIHELWHDEWYDYDDGPPYSPEPDWQVWAE